MTPRVLEPTSYDEAALQVLGARTSGVRLAPRGAGTRGWLGRPPPADLVPVSTARLAGVVHHEPDDLTVTAQAGMRLANLQQRLQAAGQWLPVNPPGARGATLGGLLATGAVGSLRFRFGGWRDLVLGLRVVLADGRIAHSGGRVVKNVAGYDVHKLHVGALGTLGLIVEASLRVQPLPESRRLLVASFSSWPAALDAATTAVQSQAEPAAVETFDAETLLAGRDLLGRQFGVVVAIRLAGPAAAVEAGAPSLLGILRGRGGRDGQDLEGRPCQEAWEFLDEVPHLNEVAVRISAPPAALADLLGRGELPATWQVAADTATGVAVVSGPPGAGAREIETMTAGVRGRLGTTGTVTVYRAPEAVRSTVEVWGPLPAAYPLMLGVKRALDPGGLWNPGRFLGEL